MRIRRSDLDAFVAAGSAPDSAPLQDELATAVTQARHAIGQVDDPDVPARLRALADAANRLADALEGPGH